MSSSSTGRRVRQSSARRPEVEVIPRLRPDRSMPRHRQRLIRAIGQRAERVLAADEEVLALTEAVEDAPRSTRVILGAAWAPCQRVALLFTGRRLIEIGVSAGGRRALGRVRSFPWDGIPSLQIVDDRLEVRSWDGDLHKWYLREVPDPEIEGRLNRRVNLAVSTFVPSRSRTAPLRHCTACGHERPAQEENCRYCGATIRTPRRASQLAVALPGAGHLYAGRTLGAAVRFAVETGIFVCLAMLVLHHTNPWRVLMVVVAGSGLLGLAKIHGAWSARMLTARAGAVTAKAQRAWRWLVPVGIILSVAALLAPLTMIGALDRRVDWDLSFVDSNGVWRPVLPEDDNVAETGASVRAVWSDTEGHRVVLKARPFPPFKGADQVASMLANRDDVDDHPVLVGSHSVLEMAGTGADGRPIISELVIDPKGRDVHSLVTTTEPGEEAEARNRMRWLLERAIWVKPRGSD